MKLEYRFENLYAWLSYRLYALQHRAHCTLTESDMLEIYRRDKAHLMKRPEMDRINCDMHYTKINCQFLEKEDNLRKAGGERAMHRRRRVKLGKLERWEVGYYEQEKNKSLIKNTD